MSTELNKQITKLKVQAKHCNIKLKIDMTDGLAMIYPEHRKDVAASIGYMTPSRLDIVAYVIDLKRLHWAEAEGFTKEQMQKEKRLNILKEVRPQVLINHLV